MPASFSEREFGGLRLLRARPCGLYPRPLPNGGSEGERVAHEAGALPAGRKKDLQKENRKGIIRSSTKAAGSDGVQIVGRLDLDLYRRFFPDVTTDDVIITQERVAHVLAHHQQEEHKEVFDRLLESLQKPNYLIKDTSPHTAIVLRRFPEQREQYRIILRLHMPDDPPEYKSSVITAFYISEKTYQKYERKYEREAQILYKQE